MVALIQWSVPPLATLPSAADLAAWCRARLQAYKVPRSYFVCSGWLQTASAKTDHQALGRRLAQHLAGDTEQGAPWLQVLR